MKANGVNSTTGDNFDEYRTVCISDAAFCCLQTDIAGLFSCFQMQKTTVLDRNVCCQSHCFDLITAATEMKGSIHYEGIMQVDYV